MTRRAAASEPGRTESTAPLLAAVDVSVGFDGIPALCGASMQVHAGRRTVLLGANGSGKTTLLRCLAGALRPDRGAVTVDGHPLRHDRAGLRHHRGRVQLVVQDPDDQLFAADVRGDVAFGPLNLGLSPSQVAARTAEALDMVGLTGSADSPVHRLSFGQRKRVAIAGALAMHPDVLLLDEPTAGLDPAGVEELLCALHRLEEAGTTVVMAVHDVDLAHGWADSVAVVVDGSVVQSDPSLLADRDVVRRSRLRRPWAIDLLERLGIPTDPVPRSLGETAAALRSWRSGESAVVPSTDDRRSPTADRTDIWRQP